MPTLYKTKSNINPIRKARVKQSLLKGNSIRQALKDGGYAPGTQRGKNNGTTNPVVKVCLEEIAKEFKSSDVTVDAVLKRLKQIELLAIDHKDFSAAVRCSELHGKYLAMFTDKVKSDAVITLNDVDKIEIDSIYSRLKPLALHNQS